MATTGLDAANVLIAEVSASEDALAQLSACVNRCQEAMTAINQGHEKARQLFVESKAPEFAIMRSAEVTKRLGEVLNPVVAEPEPAAPEIEIPQG